MVANNLKSDVFSSDMLFEIEQTIIAMRRQHGLFETKYFKPIIRLLENNWLPDEIPIILPSPFYTTTGIVK